MERERGERENVRFQKIISGTKTLTFGFLETNLMEFLEIFLEC